MDRDSIIAALQNVPLTEAIPFGAGTTPQGDPTALSNMVSALGTLPQRAIQNSQFSVSTGNYDPRTSIETALVGAGGGMPAAEKGAAGIFGGRLAKAADQDALMRTYERMQNKEHPADIWAKEGWMFDPVNGKFMFEIPDNRMSVMEMGAKGPAELMVSHPELYKNYPELRGMPLSTTVEPKNAGQFTPTHFNAPQSPREIWAAGPDRSSIREPIAHEFQHAVQEIEGWSPGTNVDWLRNHVNKWNKGERAPDSPLKHLPEDYVKKLNPQDPGYDLYNRVAGEQQAWNTGGRVGLDVPSRALRPPWTTHTVPFEKQLYLHPTDPSGNWDNYLKVMQEVNSYPNKVSQSYIGKILMDQGK